jgi:tRNA-uridine 2-sulfurtransferase
MKEDSGQERVAGGYGPDVAAGMKNCGPARRLSSPTGTGEAGSASCGSLVRVELAVDDGRIVDAAFQAYGCPATIASARHVVESARDLSLVEAAKLGEVVVSGALRLSAEKQSSVANSVDALHRALGAVVASGLRSSAQNSGRLDDRAVLVGMSGGVDSTVAAMLLLEEGYSVVGVTLSLWHEPGAAGAAACCSPETVRRARRVAHSLGIPHFTIDASELFMQRVVEYFVKEYESGRTPNPCAKCNARVRFGLMNEVAHSLGAAWIATGHYATLTDPGNHLARGVDGAKDQSYVLAEVDPSVLSHVLFPLGRMLKEQVRKLAAEAGFEGHSAPESQEICFIADNDHRRFLRERLAEKRGRLVDKHGRDLGVHSGIHNFTIGQRKGLGIASMKPLYVIGIDYDRSEVTVGDVDDLYVDEVTIGSLTWHQEPPKRPVLLQVRSMGAPVAGVLRLEVAPEDDGTPELLPDRVVVELIEPIRAVAPGQTAVVYSNEEVLCGGTIIGAGRAAVSHE